MRPRPCGWGAAAAAFIGRAAATGSITTIARFTNNPILANGHSSTHRTSDASVAKTIAIIAYGDLIARRTALTMKAVPAASHSTPSARIVASPTVTRPPMRDV
jgi:hypothetical protein